MTKQCPYWVPGLSAPDAVARAKGYAREEGFTVDSVCLVKWSPKEAPYRPGWSVTLALRERAT